MEQEVGETNVEEGAEQELEEELEEAVEEKLEEDLNKEGPENMGDEVEVEYDGEEEV